MRFFFDGLSGLTIAIGAVLTLAILMRATAQLDWSEVFALRKRRGHDEPPVLPSSFQA